MREAAAIGQVVFPHERGRLPLGAEPQILELHHHDYRIVVVGFQNVDVGGSHPRHGVELIDVHRPAAAHLDRIVRKGVVPFDRRQQRRMFQAEILGNIGGGDEERFRTGTGHHAVEQMDRIGDRPRRHVIVERQLLLHDRLRIGQRIVALGDADLAEILAGDATAAHVVIGQQRERPVRAAKTVGVAGVLCETREARQQLGEGIDLVRVAADAGDDRCVTGFDRPCGAAQRHHRAGAAHGDGIEPARCQTKMLGEAHRTVGRERKARHRQAVEIGGPDTGANRQFLQRPGDPPMGAVLRIAHIGKAHRNGDGNVAVGSARIASVGHVTRSAS